MGVSGQRNAPAALYLREKDPRHQLDRRLGGPQLICTQRLYKKSFPSGGDRNPVVLSVVRHYTDWTTHAPKVKLSRYRHVDAKGERKYSSYSLLTWVVSVTLYPREKRRIPTGQEAGWVSELAWTQRAEEKSFASASARDRGKGFLKL
jgi:hypothetical protein